MEIASKVSEEDSQVTSNVINNISVPNLNDNDVEDVMEWLGHTALGIPNDSQADQSAAVIQANGLYHTR